MGHAQPNLFKNFPFVFSKKWNMKKGKTPPFAFVKKQYSPLCVFQKSEIWKKGRLPPYHSWKISGPSDPGGLEAPDYGFFVVEQMEYLPFEEKNALRNDFGRTNFS
jgi:hypothetical protein